MYNNFIDDVWFEIVYVNMRYRDFIIKKFLLFRFLKFIVVVRLVNKS